MKSVIGSIASKNPNLSDTEFHKLYLEQHPRADSLGPDNLRSAFQHYLAVLRKQKRRLAGISKPGQNKQHNPTRLGGSL